MKHSSTKIHRIANSKALHIAVFAIAMLSFTLHGWNAQAANVIPTDYRLATADDKFADAWKFMLVFKVRPRRCLRAKRVELAISTLSTSQEIRPFVSFGPVWRLPIDSRSLFIALWVSPTLLERPSFSGRHMTGNFHLTSSTAVGAILGARGYAALSPGNQCTSHRNLNSTNPGMDMIGLNLFINSSNRRMHRTGETS